MTSEREHREQARGIVLEWLMAESVALTGVRGEVPREQVATFKSALEQRIASALSSRDTEIREVLEGLMRTFSDERCWCGEGDYVHNDQDKACLAARALYAKLQPKEASDVNIEKN